ncbi:MAG: hypothetical protein ACI4A3_04950 [Lachnospiraceae bacterium]
MNKIFLIACFLIPFENFFFAPSSGWAAIAPLLFFAYTLLNFKQAIKVLGRNCYLLLMLIWGTIVTLINYFFIDINIGNLIGTMISIGLGLSFYLALEIYFSRNNDLNKIVDVLTIAYGISIVVGLIQFVAIKTGNTSLINIISVLEKRSYIFNGRVQFTFTEPSFIGMHVYGILLPVYMLTKNRKMRNLMFVYVVLAIVMGCGVRIITDTAVFLLIFFFIKLDLKKIKNMIALFGVIIISILGSVYIYNTNYRVRSIVKVGVYADGSLASRWFRINASIKGYNHKKLNALFGYGYGNALIPLQDGHAEAKSEYKHWNTREIDSLIDSEFSSDSVAYCLYIRIISEFGLVLFWIIAFYLIKYWKYLLNSNMKIIFFMILYLYLQFDSYAFYSIWILLYILRKNKKMKVSENKGKCVTKELILQKE